MNIFKTKYNFLFFLFIALACFSGIGFYLLYQEKIMIIFSYHNKITNQNAENSSLNQSADNFIATLYIPNSLNVGYTIEKATIKVTQSIQDNHASLVSAWLSAQNSVYKKNLLQNIALSSSQEEIFIHFANEQTPFDPQTSTYDKLLWIEGLLKTLHSYNNKIEYVYFLANKKPLNDPELDFSYPWPIKGFL